jgi:hypothetical protein
MKKDQTIGYCVGGKTSYHEEIDHLRARLAKLLEAIGLMSTAKPDMQVRPDDPVWMAREVVRLCAAKDAEIAELKAKQMGIDRNLGAGIAEMATEIERQRKIIGKQAKEIQSLHLRLGWQGEELARLRDLIEKAKSILEGRG